MITDEPKNLEYIVRKMHLFIMISSLENLFNEFFQLLNFKFKMNKIRSLQLPQAICPP